MAISYRAVVAIDFGTSRSGYAYAFTEDRTIYGRTDWPGQMVPYCKAPTRLLYDGGAEPIGWGYEASSKLAQLLLRGAQAEGEALRLNDGHHGLA
jgi:hypothetical protein